MNCTNNVLLLAPQKITKLEDYGLESEVRSANQMSTSNKSLPPTQVI